MTAHRSSVLLLILLCSASAFAQQRSPAPPRTLAHLPNGLGFVLAPGRTCSDGQPVSGVWRKISAAMASGVPTSGPLFTQLSRIRQRQQSWLDLIKAVYPDPSASM